MFIKSEAASTLESPDSLLAELVLMGDENAMMQLFDRHSKAAYSVAVRILQDRFAAENIMHEIFMQIWREPSTFIGACGNLAASIVVMSRNRAVTLLRKTSSGEHGVPILIPARGVVENYRGGKLIRSREDSVRGRLSPEQSGVLDMVFFKGLTVAQIALETGCTPAAVKTLVSSALGTLRTAQTAPSSIAPSLVAAL